MSARKAAQSIASRIEERIDAGREDHQLAIVRQVDPLKVELTKSAIVLEAGGNLKLSAHVREYVAHPGLEPGDNLAVHRMSGNWTATQVLSNKLPQTKAANVVEWDSHSDGLDLEVNVENNEARIDTLDTDVGTLNGEVASLTTDVAAAAADIATAQTDITAAEADIVTAQGDIITSQADIAALRTVQRISLRGYGAVGNGTTNDTSAINAATAAASAAGGGSVICEAGLYKFISTLTIPDGVTLHFDANAKLYCYVTGGGDGIVLGENSGLVGEGGHGNVVSSPPQGFCGVVAADSAVIDALVATTSGVSQVHIRDVFLLTSGGGAGTANSVLDIRGMDGGMPYIQGVMCYAGNHAKNGLRIRSVASHSAEEIVLDKVWVLGATEDAIKMDCRVGGPGIVNVSLTNFAVVNWGDGFSGLKLDGSEWDVFNVYVRNWHMENTASVSTATRAILADTIRHCTFENIYFNATNPTNKTGIKIQQTTSGGAGTFPNDGNVIRNFKSSSASLTNLLNDAEKSVTIGGEYLASYSHQSVQIRVKAGVPSDSDFVYPPPVGTEVLDTTNNRRYSRTGSNVWKYSALT